MTPKPVRATTSEDGALLHLVLDRPKGNVLDIEMIGCLHEAIAQLRRPGDPRTVLFEGAGAHFSFGASVQEHLAPHAGRMLAALHGFFRELAASGRVLLAAVRGQCLGAGLELACFCHRVFAAPDARLASPEIRLGVFAPIASLVLPARIGQPRADDLLLSGRNVPADEALAMGLVDEIAADPAAAALAWHHKHLAPLSARALGLAVVSARQAFHAALAVHLDEVERRYLDELMATDDANEGLSAFLEKRAPAWSHR
jgi:cyclohexa-1,5-dienecarbonyl-CoA hydratase